MDDFIAIDDFVDSIGVDLMKKIWSKRCNVCPAPCCSVRMWGHTYTFDHENMNDKDIAEMTSFFTNSWVTINFYSDSWTDNIQGGFKITLNPPELENGTGGLAVCPLSIHGNCLIYEDRPKTCRTFYCDMKKHEFKK